MKNLKTSIVESYIKESTLDTSVTTSSILAAAVDLQNNLTGVLIGGIFKLGSSAQKNAEKIIKSLNYTIIESEFDIENDNCAYMIYNDEKNAVLVNIGKNNIYILNSI